ncbi:13501_t:CDS:2, partial [Cetraspora pellucida]
ISEFSAKVLPTISLAILKNVIKLTEGKLELLQDFDIDGHCPIITRLLKGHCIKCRAADHTAKNNRTPSSKLQLLLSSSTPESQRKNENN